MCTAVDDTGSGCCYYDVATSSCTFHEGASAYYDASATDDYAADCTVVVDGGQGNTGLKINEGYNGNNLNSDFDVAEVITWDRGLTEDETWAAYNYLRYHVLGARAPPL